MTRSKSGVKRHSIYSFEIKAVLDIMNPSLKTAHPLRCWATYFGVWTFSSPFQDANIKIDHPAKEKPKYWWNDNKKKIPTFSKAKKQKRKKKEDSIVNNKFHVTMLPAEPFSSRTESGSQVHSFASTAKSDAKREDWPWIEHGTYRWSLRNCNLSLYRWATNPDNWN